MELKYLIFNDLIPVIFPEVLLHADIAAAYPGHYPTSAGFYDPTTGCVFGESVGLSLRHKASDAQKIAQFYGVHANPYPFEPDPSEEH